MTRHWIGRGLWLLAAAVVAAPVSGQRLDGTGTVATGLLLRQMDGVKRVLMIAAHPDDEDTSFLTTMGRGLGAETAYLSLTRGDGGQNLIGPELWEGLGIVRTGELLAARERDGGGQFFTRAFDYGYSKTADEALSFWPREELLRDVVWVIRSYRPHVIVSIFSGTPRDGHGQHQAAGIISREAFAAAGDPSRFPDQLDLGVDAWAPMKLYQTSRRRFFPQGAEIDDGSLDIQTGVHDPLLGRSLLQLSMESRSQHRSQDMGAAQPPGPRMTGIILVDSRVEDQGQEIFSGVDTTLVGLADGLPAPARDRVVDALQSYRASVRQARESMGLDPEEITPLLMSARTDLERAAYRASGDQRELEFALAQKHDVATRAVMASTGVSFQVRSEDDLLVPGQTTQVSAMLWNGGSYSLTDPDVSLSLPEGWSAREIAEVGLVDGGVAPGALGVWTFEVSVPADADPTRLYYLQEERDGARYRWPDDPALWSLPRDPALVSGEVGFSYEAPEGMSVDAARYTTSAEWRFVDVDPAFGEFDKAVLVVPAVSVQVTPAGVTWPQARTGSGTISVAVRGERDEGVSGAIEVAAPAGWSVSPARAEFELAASGAERTLTFEITPSAGVAAGEHAFEVTARTDEGAVYSEGYSLIDYEHIERAALYQPSIATVSVVPVAVAEGLRVGYIMGSGDQGPEAIRQMGGQVELLDEARVREANFDEFSSIVLGVRAYETRPDLQAASGQLLDYARRGGTVVVQYNRGPLGRLAPMELQVGRGSPRVSDETAEVRLLDTSAPVFTGPNRITAADFDGWVQERGLYFASEWDDGYVPLLSLNDPGEPAREGALLAASVGDGVFVYSALSFFRQWAGQVPGAYRLFANLISLDGADWQAYEAGR
ncbi:MAG: PIG-L family deacetylase [Gemmatimonadota bacterium]